MCICHVESIKLISFVSPLHFQSSNFLQNANINAPSWAQNCFCRKSWFLSGLQSGWSVITLQGLWNSMTFPECCSPRGKSLFSKTNLQVLVLGSQFQGLCILQTVRYVWSCDVHKFCYRHLAWGYGQECLTDVRYYLLMWMMSASKPFLTVTQCCCPPESPCSQGPIYKSLSSIHKSLNTTMHFPDFSRHSYPCCGYPRHAYYATRSTMLVNTGVAPTTLSQQQFSWQDFFLSYTCTWLLVNFLTFVWQRSNSLDISRYSRQVVTLNST